MNAAVFRGMSQYNRYLIAFMKFVAEHKVELKKLGVQHGDLGTHSCSKGIGTMVSAGCTISPTIISIYIRCGWVMGGAKDKYLKYGAACDQYVVRCASGLNQLSKEFAVTPEYFDFFGEINDEVEREKLKKDLQKWLEIRAPNFGVVLTLTQHLIQYLFASVCYHPDFLDKHLHVECSLRASAFLKVIPRQFTKIVRVRYPWDNDVTNACIPNCSGITPHVMILSEVEHKRN